MNKSQLADAIKSRIVSLDSIISDLMKTNIPDDSHLVTSKIRDKTYYYIVTGSMDSRKRSFLTDANEIEKLANKMYNDRLLDAARKEKKQLELCYKHLLKQIANSNVEDVYDSLPNQISKFVRPHKTTDKGFIASWQSKHNGITKKDNSHIHKTMKGDYVRSKSEALIADRFFSMGIPYEYEQLGLFDEIRGMILHPDFKVLNKRTKKTFIWEHCGKMDDSKYSNDCLYRLQVFSRHGYLQGKNLLFTYETNETPLDLDYVDKIIKNYLL